MFSEVKESIFYFVRLEKLIVICTVVSAPNSYCIIVFICRLLR